MTKRFNSIDSKLNSKADKADTARIYGLLDTVAKEHEAEEQERLILNNQVSKHERWIGQASQKLGLKT